VSQVRPDIDLSALSRAPTTIARPKRSPWRIVLPALILLVFLGVLGTSLRGVFETRKPVSLVRPRPLVHAAGGAPSTAQPRILLQAAGWVEPDPFPIEVAALTPGVVREVLVLEAERVEAGQVIARLIDADAKLALAAAEAELLAAQAELDAASRAATIEATRFERALEVTEGERTLAADVEGAKSDVLEGEADMRRAEAQLRVERDELALQKELEANGATAPRVLELAQARVDAAQAELDVSRASTDSARAQVQSLGAKYARARTELELRLNDSLALSNAEAAHARARSELAKAQVARDQAQLRLSRTEVVAPAAGIVLERRAVPGSRLDEGADALVCTLFDPAQLRVRVDVPQGDIARLQVGARAEVASDSRPGKPYAGRIVRLVQKADIQKVTLQVHVRIEDGDEWLRPEMLAQVRFLSDPGAGPAGAATGSGGESVEIPTRVLEDEKYVWIVDGVEGTARRVELELGSVRGEWVEVRSGLDLSAKLIDGGRAQLSPGDRVSEKEQQP